MKSTISKISAPKAQGIYPRERLFGKIDDALRKPLLWIASPPGSGKTSLLAGYLEDRKIPFIWYQADEGDSDIAGFFYYMGLAAKQAFPRMKKALPLLTPEYLQGVSTFTRRYFEKLCERMPHPFVIVFDNCHEVPGDSAFFRMLVDCCEALPEGVTVVALSRTGPPEHLLRLRANNRMVFIGWNDMRFTLEEVRGAVKTVRRGRCLEVECPGPEILFAKTDGWAAGLRLIIEATQPQRRIVANSPPGAPVCHCVESVAWHDNIFSYFACEVMSRIPAEIHDFLLATSVLPFMTPAIAAKLTGRDAAAILRDLSRRHFFTDWYAGPEPVYQYHSLFREFLLKTAAERFDVAEIAVIRRNAAALLYEAGMTGEAVELYLDAGAWDEAAELVSGEAEKLIMQGRSAVLENRLLRFPENIFDERPWILYWLGVAKLGRCPAEGRGLLERALRLFDARCDETGMLLTWAAATESVYYAFDDYREFDGWIAWLDARKPLELAYPAPRVELSVCISMVTALVARQPYHPDLDAWIGRLLALFQKHREEFASFQAATIFAFYHYYWRGDFFMMGVQAAEIQNMAKSGAAPPLFKVVSEYLSAEVALDCKGDPGACLLHVRSALRIAEETGAMVLNEMLLGLGTYSAILTGDLVLGEEFLTRLQSTLTPERKHTYCHYYYLAAFVAAMRAEHDRARDFMRLALKFAEETGFFYPLIMCLTRMAVLMHQDDEAGEADQLLERALALSTSSNSAIFRYACLLEKSRFAFDRGQESDGVTLLAEALHIGARGNFFGPLWWREPAVMARLCAKALEYGIEPEYARMLIRANRLEPGEDAPDDWPWPLKIYTLGRFEILKNDGPLSFEGKLQKKPVEMLKAIIAFGGRDVPEERIMDALWPDADGDAARTSLKTVLHRLRQGLGDERYVLLKNNRISLSEDYCWVDLFSFQSAVKSAESGEASETGSLAQKAALYYKGPFLPDDSSKGWIGPMREKARRAFIRVIGISAEAFRKAGRPGEAATQYEKAVEADELDEDICMGLMECYAGMRRKDRVAKAYNRYTEALRMRLDAEPSDSIRALYENLMKRK